MNAEARINRRHPLAPPVDEMFADAHWETKFSSPVRPWGEPFDGDVLVTGATGFVAPFVLDQLIRFASFKVICVVRARTDDHADQRVRARLQELGLGATARSDRLECLAGDLSVPNFGLSRERLQSLAERVAEIFHFGSVVRWFTRYSAARACDVQGTRAILDLAAHTRIKRVHVGASMASQALVHGVDASAIEEDSTHAHPERLLGGYCQTKWVVEAMARQARAAGLPINVFRLGDIKGVAATGVGNALDFGYSLMSWCLAQGAAPLLDYRVSYLPVDEVAWSMVQIARRDQGRGRLYQFTNPQDATWDHVLDFMDTHAPGGVRLARLPLKEFSRRLQSDTRTGPARRTKPSFRGIRPGGALPRTSFMELGLELYRRSHTTDNTRHMLPETPFGVRTRLLSDGLLERYVRFAAALVTQNRKSCAP